MAPRRHSGGFGSLGFRDRQMRRFLIAATNPMSPYWRMLNLHRVLGAAALVGLAGCGSSGGRTTTATPPRSFRVGDRGVVTEFVRRQRARPTSNWCVRRQPHLQCRGRSDRRIRSQCSQTIRTRSRVCRCVRAHQRDRLPLGIVRIQAAVPVIAADQSPQRPARSEAVGPNARVPAGLPACPPAPGRHFGPGIRRDPVGSTYADFTMSP